MLYTLVDTSLLYTLVETSLRTPFSLLLFKFSCKLIEIICVQTETLYKDIPIICIIIN